MEESLFDRSRKPARLPRICRLTASPQPPAPPHQKISLHPLPTPRLSASHESPPSHPPPDQQTSRAYPQSPRAKHKPWTHQLHFHQFPIPRFHGHRPGIQLLNGAHHMFLVPMRQNSRARNNKQIKNAKNCRFIRNLQNAKQIPEYPTAAFSALRFFSAALRRSEIHPLRDPLPAPPDSSDYCATFPSARPP